MEQFHKCIMDGIDVETFFACSSEEEGRRLMLGLLAQMRFADIDIVFAQHAGPGARVRGRAYVYRPAATYGWLESSCGKESAQ